MILKASKRAFQKLTSINENNWDFYLKFFPWIEKGVVLFELPIINKIVKNAAFLGAEKRHFSQGHIIPLDHNINYKEKYKNTILPYTLLENIIKESSYNVIMNKCYCRDSLKCKNHSSEFGCIMIGEGAKTIEKSGIAHEASAEEALTHLKKAADTGLVAMALWIELEAFGMGLTDKEHRKLMEICLCCPCCCLGLRNFKKWGNDIMKRFDSIGWSAAFKEGCNSCQKCVKTCPMEALKMEGDSIIFTEKKCIGCGLCAAKCPNEAIEMVQTAPFKNKMQDYFWGFKLEV